jgi:hypothetical protein
LNHLDFYLWEHLKPLCIQLSVRNAGTLHQHTVNVWKTIHNHLEIFERVWQSMIRCAKVCITPHGGHFEHFLQMGALSAATLRGSICGFTFLQTCFLFLICEAHMQSLSTHFRFMEFIPKVCPHISDSSYIT